MIEQLRIIMEKKNTSSKNAVKHLDPCFLTTFVKSRYLEVILEKSSAYKSKYTLKYMLS